MRNCNAWRWELDPRDPDYCDPPEVEGFDEEPDLDYVHYDDPRCNGPMHYQPMRSDV